MSHKIDHIVYAVPDLPKAIDELEKKLGVRATIGGKHETKGTQNALINLGDGCYLEIIAIDKENKESKDPIWMGLELIEKPQITRWALKSVNISKDVEKLRNFSAKLGEVESGSRRLEDGSELNWKMSKPSAAPKVELLPFLTDWSASDGHPTDSLEEKCKFMCMEFYHTNPDKIRPTFKAFTEDYEIKKGDRDVIYLYVEAPTGIVKL